jgi:hypothetical protein
MDETNKQLVSEKQTPIPMKPGEEEKYDYEYERQGTRNLFTVVEPLTGERHVKITEQRTKKDWAKFIQEVVDIHYKDAEKVILVMDNLNTHVPYVNLKRQDASLRNWRSTIHRSMRAGSIWQRLL